MNESKAKCCGTFLAYLIAVVGAFLIVAGLVWIMNSYTKPQPLGEDRAIVRRKALAELRASNIDVLSSYAWQDQAKGIVRLPMVDKETGGPGRAMELALQLWQNPAAARSNLTARVEKATALPPKVSYE